MADWVATNTWVGSKGVFYEAGGIYDHVPSNSAFEAARPLAAREPEAACPRCGQRFAGTDEGTAQSHRDRHVDGDQGCRSICARPEAAPLPGVAKR